MLKLPSGEPAAGATVKVLDEPFAGAPPGAQTQTATAGQDGSFAFDNLEPGNYWIVAKRPDRSARQTVPPCRQESTQAGRLVSWQA